MVLFKLLALLSVISISLQQPRFDHEKPIECWLTETSEHIEFQMIISSRYQETEAHFMEDLLRLRDEILYRGCQSHYVKESWGLKVEQDETSGRASATGKILVAGKSCIEDALIMARRDPLHGEHRLLDPGLCKAKPREPKAGRQR